ncbi:MAG: hypothetical protein ACPG8N_08915, partial [Rhodothermales bacterium]
YLPLQIMFEVRLDRARLVRFLSVTATVLLGMHAILYVIHFQVVEIPWYALQLFDVNEEHNLPTWFSGFNLGISTLFLWLISREKSDWRTPSPPDGSSFSSVFSTCSLMKLLAFMRP